ncbi:zinc finger matrin-type protein 5 [Oryzias latipes]|uniref:Zinc finger matrin-type protein 5 n=3 Tax=Oryzias TaxID=8089 RepID=A0A3P9H847_ORYLA|nr:zinc finger matrin-type protein 5 [Oryzias latipes]XP_011480115.1 zinc finger matrin-type protein 5 [Oryzias latipes]
MGKRYYCDYCDRSFQDNMHNRKKHLNGVQHHRAKKAWFDQFRDSAAILYDEQVKKTCRKFLLKGFCDFGANCRFSHMSEEEQLMLKRQLEDEKQNKEDAADRMMAGRSVQEWLSKREKRKAALSSKGDLKTKEDREEVEEDNEIPHQLLSMPDLPPSLLPPPPGGWRVFVNAEWD